MYYQFNKRWHSPVQTYAKLSQLAEKIGGAQVINNDPKYKKAKEAGIAAAIALVLTKIRNVPTFLRLPKHDPPDAFLMQPSPTRRGGMDISTIEITQYDGKQGTLLEQLKKSQKITYDYHKYSEEYILLVALYAQEGIDYQAINNYLKATQTPFVVWTMWNYSSSPDTISEIVMVDENSIPIRFNIGEEGYRMELKKIPGIVYSKRVGSLSKVKATLAKPIDINPWEELED